jgi:hypothetical protein
MKVSEKEHVRVVDDADAADSLPLASLDGADLRHQLPDFLIILFVWGHAEALLELVGNEEAKACVRHDADTDVYPGSRRKALIPSLRSSAWVKYSSALCYDILPDAHGEY